MSSKAANNCEIFKKRIRENIINKNQQGDDEMISSDFIIFVQNEPSVVYLVWIICNFMHQYCKKVSSSTQNAQRIMKS